MPSPTQREPPRLPHTACVAKAVASDAHSTATNASTPRCKHRQRFARSSCRAARSVATRRTLLSRLSPSESLGSDRGDAPACNFSSVLRRRCRRSTNTSDARRRSRAPARRRRRRVDGTRSPRAAFQAPPGLGWFRCFLPSWHVRSTPPRCFKAKKLSLETLRGGGERKIRSYTRTPHSLRSAQIYIFFA